MSDCHFENGVDVVETSLLCPGDDITTFQLNGFKCGIAICYDAGFDEFIKLYGRAGMNYANFFIYVNHILLCTNL